MKELWVPLSGAIAQQRKVEVIANNVANANTPGFKKDDIAFKEYLTALNKNSDPVVDLPQKEWAPEDFYRSSGAEHSFVKEDGIYTNFQQGQLTPTSNPFDLAINGPGFFEIMTPQGVRYTRHGSFSLSAERELVTAQGNRVLGGDGGVIDTSSDPALDANARVIKINSPQFHVAGDGTISNDAGVIARLALVDFTDPGALKKEGTSLFINPIAQNRKVLSPESQVQQGFIEESNVNAIGEMSELIKANRHFESIQRAIKTYDTIAGKSVSEIARF